MTGNDNEACVINLKMSLLVPYMSQYKKPFPLRGIRYYTSSMSATCTLRQHTSAYVSIRQHI